MRRFLHVFRSIFRRARQPRTAREAPKHMVYPSHQMIWVLALMLNAGDAEAMNQEGHDDDWITGFPPALQLLEAIPEARPLSSRSCPVTPEMIAANPYEQIQLPRHLCRPGMAIKVLPPAPPVPVVSVED